MQQRISNFGDASLYLHTGHQLSELIITSHGLTDFFNQLLKASTVIPGSHQSFTATGLTDRLLMDGPVFPAYLALMQICIGIGAGTPGFDGHCLQIASFNAFFDSLHCVLIYYLGRLVFSKKVGLAAGLLFAVYPPAILTTQQCYSEPFAGFILTAWICLGFLTLQRHTKPSSRYLVPISFGASTALLLLTRPAFSMMPIFAFAAVVLAIKYYKKMEPPSAVQTKPAVPAQSYVQSPDGVKPEPKVEQPPVTNIAFSTSYTKPIGVTKPPSVIVIDDYSKNAKGPDVETSTEESTDFSPPPVTESEEASKEATVESASEPNPEASEPAVETSESSPETLEPIGETSEPTAETTSEIEQPDTKPSTPPTTPLIPKSLQIRLACFLIGIVTVMGTWVGFTCAVTGKAQLINRAPEYNLFIGNQLIEDGWKTIPIVEGVPDSVGKALGSIGQAFVSHPIEFLSLQIRKLGRLWLGGWNDFQFDLFGVSRHSQAVWHGLMLWFAFIGAAMSCVVPKSKREHIKTSVLVAVVLFHFTYTMFEPVSRYCMTAMPSIMILAAYSLSIILSASPIRPFRILIHFAALIFFFGLLAGFASNLPTLLNIFPPTWLPFARVVDAGIFACAWIVLGAWASLFLKNEFRVVRLGVLLCAVITCVHMLGDPEWREWFVELRTIRQVVTQEVFVPEKSEDRTAPGWRHVFVLVDIESPDSVPPMAVMVNGVPIAEPLLTWFQVSRRKDVLEGLAQEGSAMGRDPRSFRQWWAFPVPSELLKFGDNNRIQVAITSDDVPIGHRLFGDYERPHQDDSGESTTMPSFNTVSFTKGFATYGTGEPRIYANQRLSGRTMRASLAVGKDTTTSDLSLEHGRQIGSYRIRVAVPYPKAGTQKEPGQDQGTFAALSDSNRMLLLVRDERRVSGSDPNTFFLGEKATLVPSGLLPGTRIYLSAELRNPKNKSACGVTLRLQGTDKEGKTREWTSAVAASRIAVGPQWKKYALCDFIPDDMLALTDLSASVMVLPFPPDKIFLHHDRTKRDIVFVRNLSLTLLDAVDVPEPQDCDWLFY